MSDEYGQLLRPGVVWFGGNVPHMTWETSVEAVSTTDILLVIGAKVVEINLVPTSVSPLADATLIGPSGQILPKLVQ